MSGGGAALVSPGKGDSGSSRLLSRSTAQLKKLVHRDVAVQEAALSESAQHRQRLEAELVEKNTTLASISAEVSSLRRELSLVRVGLLQDFSACPRPHVVVLDHADVVSPPLVSSRGKPCGSFGSGQPRPFSTAGGQWFSYRVALSSLYAHGVCLCTSACPASQW